MIGIDITRISRFKEMTHLNRFIEKFNVDGDTPVAAAKTWACLEAIYKAEGGGVESKDVRILFPKNKSPRVIEVNPVLKYEYTLTLSHEDDLLIAVALGTPKKMVKLYIDHWK